MNDQRLTRRAFIGSTAASMLLPRLGEGGPAPLAPNLRVGIVSDIHLTAVSNGQWFEKALRAFDAAKADAVAITGDLALSGTVDEIAATAAIWKKVFPDDRRSDGAPIAKLFVTGNHDVMDKAAYRVKSREQLEREGFYCRREQVWRELFGEDYLPLTVKSVKGYTFILRHWQLRNEPTVPLAETLAELSVAKAAKPFFYLQHAPLDNTVNASWLVRGTWWNHGQDRSPAIRRALEGRRNAVVLTGHSHFPLNEEESIWQGSFTAVNCGCLRGNLFTVPGRENGINCDDMPRNPPFEMECMERRGIHQMLLMEVFDDRIVFHRRDVKNDEPLAEDWVVPLDAQGAAVPSRGAPGFDPRTRAAALPAPAFAPGAKVTVEYVKVGYRRTPEGYRGLDREHPHPQLKVVFPPVTRRGGSPSRALDFSVRCLARTGDCVRIVDERRVYSPNAYFAESRDVEPCWCNFPLGALPLTEELAFEVTPFNVFGKPGQPIRSGYEKLTKFCAESPLLVCADLAQGLP